MSECDVIIPLLRQAEHPRFMDLGAHVGGDSEWMCGALGEREFQGIAVEADPQNYASLKNRKLPIRTCFGAVSSYTGVCDFWVCEHPPAGRGSGSIRRPTGHLMRGGEPYTFRKIQIPCITLDDLFQLSGFDHLDLLWVDIQGGERDMIAAGQETLKRSRYLFIESEYAEELYEGQAMREELLSMLPDWKVIESFDFNLLMRHS